MGNPKQKWTTEEEEALRAGVAKHGTGKWKIIQRDPEFNHLLFSRSNIDLKDKWRNMSVSNSPGIKEKSRAPKPKASSEAPAAPLSNPQTSIPAVTVTHDASADTVMDDSSRTLTDGKVASWYNAMIFEALSTLKDSNGLDTSTIVNFVEQRHEGPVPPNFRRLLTARLRRLAQQDKLEKVQNGFYRLKREDPLSGSKTPLPKQRDIRPRQVSATTTSTPYIGETEEDAAIAAAYKIAEAENKAYVAAEAVREAERVSKMSEDTDSLLQLVTEIFDRCSRGEIVLLA